METGKSLETKPLPGCLSERLTGNLAYPKCPEKSWLRVDVTTVWSGNGECRCKHHCRVNADSPWVSMSSSSGRQDGVVVTVETLEPEYRG